MSGSSPSARLVEDRELGLVLKRLDDPDLLSHSLE
jgi:hypothetical protein